MNQYLQQLNNLAAQNEGGGGDNNGSNQVAPGRFIFKDNKTGEFIIRDSDNNEIARSTDQQEAMLQAKKSQYPGKQIQVPTPATKSQPSLFVEPSGPRAVFNDEIDVEEQSMPQSPLGPDLRPIQPRQPGEFDATPMQTRMPSVSTDPAMAVLQGASSQTGSAVFGGSVATPTAGEAPGQEEPQRERRRRGGGATWEAPGEAMELTQEDFYPTPEPMVGQYDTGNEYVARSARMPMGALSKAAATLQNRQLEIDQKRQAFQEELYKPIKTATPYQQNFNAIVNRQREEFLQKVAQDLTGGNINKAYREIYSSPRLRTQWRELNADLEALGQRGAATFEKVTNYLNQAATNKIQSTPEMRQLANDIAMGLGGYAAADGTGGSFEKLINDMNRWDLMEGRDQYFKNTIAPSIKDFFQKIPKEIGWEIKNGRYRLLTEESVKSWDNHIRQLAVDMAVWQGYGAGDLPEEKIQDNINYLTNMLGQQVDREIKVIDTYSNISRGDGGGGGDRVSYKYAYQKIDPTEESYKDTLEALKKAGFKVHEGSTTIDSITFQEMTGAKGGVPRPISVGTTTIIPLEVSRDKNGQLYLIGKEATTSNRLFRDNRDGKEKPISQLSSEQREEIINSGELDSASFPTRAYPLSRYEDVVIQKFGIDAKKINEIINERNPFQGKTKTPTYKEIKAKVPTLTEQDYNEMMKSEEGINMARKLMNP